MSNYTKAIVGVLSAAGIVAETLWPGRQWSQAITAGVGAILVYLAPNTPKKNMVEIKDS